MWKENSSGYFQNLKIHNVDIKGLEGLVKFTPHRIKHFGYIDKEYTVKKTTNYINVGPERKELYLKHFERPLGRVIKWHEFSENKFFVLLHIFLYDLNFFSLLPFYNLKNKLTN